jgi:glycosyltransferase involved in cell wall biosynthesis
MEVFSMFATVAVVPRERFRPIVDSLRSLFATIGDDVPLIVVDGGAPKHIREQLRALREERPFDWVQGERFALPGVARNSALERSNTKYLAFCDNDLQYSPGWLEALVENAETNAAVAVSPITLIGPSDPAVIHHAGGTLTLCRDECGRTVLREYHRLDRQTLADAERSGFAGAPLDSQLYEYHCVLVDAQAMRDVGGSDERLIRHEHIDSSLRLMMAGGRLTFESRSRVMYRAFDPFVDEDWPYFLYRWALHRSDTTARVFAENWGVFEDVELSRTDFIADHRYRAMSTTLPKLPGLLDHRRVRRVLMKFQRRRIERLNPGLPDDTSPHTLPKPPADALTKAGVTCA